MGLHPAWIVPNGLFVVSIGGREQYINLARSHLNSDVSVSLAKDKYLTRLILRRQGMPNIPFVRGSTVDAAHAFLAAHGTIIAKPVTGSGSQDVHIITDLAQLQGFVLSNYILEKYIAGKEVRYLVLNSTVIGVYESKYGVSVAAGRPLRCVSYPEDTWDAQLVDDSLRIASMLGLRFAAIDYLVDSAGQYYVLEVNTTPDLKWFHDPSSGPRVDVAQLLLEAMCAPLRKVSNQGYQLGDLSHA